MNANHILLISILSYSQDWSLCTFSVSINPYTCKSNSSICLFDWEVCDGIPQCPDGSDEDLEHCSQYFPPSATISCSKVGIGNDMDVPILAIPCNNIVECSDGIDEENCGFENWILGIALGAGLLIITIISTLMVSLIELNDYSQTIDLKEVSENENAIEVRNLVIQLQQTDHELYNKIYFEMVLDQFQANYSQTLNYCKEMLGPSVIKTLLADVSSYSTSTKFKQLFAKLLRR